MKFIETLLANSSQQEAKLYGPSEKAAIKPDTGITIQNPGAFHVIKDCARIAHGYIPLFVFEHFASPFDTLKGKFTKEDIIELVDAAKTDVFIKHLLIAILNKATQMFSEASLNSSGNYVPQQTTKPLDYIPFNQTDNVNLDEIHDPYGEYSVSEQKTVSVGTSEVLDSTQDTVALLARAFDCK
jgi:hypothetical protein